jgi:hypothetical protein
MSTPDEHFEIDEIDNLIDNTEMVSLFLETPLPYKWKWVTITLHQVLYGALISVLQGTDSRQTVFDRQKDSGKALLLHVNRVPIDVIASSFGKSEETIRDWLSNPCLISLDEALRRVKRKECLPPLNNSQPLVTTAEEDDAIRKVTKVFRNEFEHFAPKGWIVFTSKMPDNVHNLLRVIRFLVFESNCVTMSLEQEQRLKNAIDNIERLLNP